MKKNKIKGCLSKPAPFTIIAAAALSLCALLPMRVYQVTTLIDPETGFFTEDSVIIPLFYIVLAAVIIAVIAISYLSSKTGRARDLTVKSLPLGIISGATALAVLIDAVMQMYSFISINYDYDAIITNITRTQYLSKSGATAILFEAVFGVFSAFFFTVYTVSCFNKKTNMRGYRILSIAPVIWSICRIIVRFIRKISFVNISDLLLELFMLVFMISFMLAFSQVITKVTPEIVAWKLFGYGIPAALLAFLVSVPRLFLMVIGHSESIVADYTFAPCDLALAIFIPVFLYNTATAKDNKSQE